MLIIAGWDETFENNRSRVIADLRWVPMPNHHDGSRFLELLEHEDGAAHYGCWSLIVQVASRCRPRGTLVHSDGSPLTPDCLARMVRVPAEIMADAIDRLFQVGWIKNIEAKSPCETSVGRHLGVRQTSGRRQEGVIEGKGREGNRKEEQHMSFGELPPKDARGAFDAAAGQNSPNSLASTGPGAQDSTGASESPDALSQDGKMRQRQMQGTSAEMHNGNEFQAAWNGLGAPFASIRAWTPKRKAALSLRLKNDWWRENWRAALGRVKTSGFCGGSGEQAWVADVDWFLRPDSAAKLLEGKYDDRDRTNPEDKRAAAETRKWIEARRAKRAIENRGEVLVDEAKRAF